jgi:dihydroneopterin aldolase
MYWGTAIYEVGRTTNSVRTSFFDSIEEVCHEIAKMCRDGRIATASVMVRINGKSHVVKSVVI